MEGSYRACVCIIMHIIDSVYSIIKVENKSTT
jgi:hypothetical protein